MVNGKPQASSICGLPFAIQDAFWSILLVAQSLRPGRPESGCSLTVTGVCLSAVMPTAHDHR
jgi:hypothetical protein